MQHGVSILQGPMDWQIFQQEDGKAEIELSGEWRVPDAAAELGIEYARPVIRVSKEDDGSAVIRWTRAESSGTVLCGSWSARLSLPAGGLYRIETGLDTRSTDGTYTWLFRGDLRFHIGVGNLFLISGQSNAAGYGFGDSYDPPDLRVHLLRNRMSWELACHPMNDSTDAPESVNSDIRVNGASPYLSFAKRFADASGMPVGLIQSAMSGQPLSRWDSREDGGLFVNMMDRVKLSGGKISGVLWYQGCAERDPEVLKNSFAHVVKEVRAMLGYEVPFFTLQLNRFGGESDHALRGALREAQRICAHELPSVYILPSSDVPTTDYIHNSSAGCVILGERLAKQCTHVLLGGSDYGAPDIISASMKADRCLSLSFDNASDFVFTGTKPSELGFSVEDDMGEIEILSISSDRGSISLTLARAPEPGGTVSYAHKADPARSHAADSNTGLPILSFYHIRISQ